MDRVKTYNIMLAFASFVSSIEELKYRSSDGTKIFEKCVQSNEPAICEMQDRLQDTGGLDRIILVESDLVNEPVHPNKPNADTWRSLLEFHGKEAMTSVEFLKAQIHKKYPQWQGDFVSSHYSEKDSVQKSMKRIAEITEHIEKTVEEARSKVAPGETLDVVLHADMTGGLRHAVMMMLAVMQMSKYMGVKIGHVFYSEYPPRDVLPKPPGNVRCVDDIHRMFDLVAGANEFQKYGSVQALEEYFGDMKQYSTAFQNLFASMRRFSEAIRICRTSVIETEMRDLAKKIAAFREEKETSIKEEMFEKIIDVIDREYATVLRNAEESGPERRLDIILWCLKKKFLQQAMTLCSEWIPEILIEKKIYYTDDSAVIEKCRKAKTDWQSWQQYAVHSYGNNLLVENKPACLTEKTCRAGIIAFLQAEGKRELLAALPQQLQASVCAFWDAYKANYAAREHRNLRLESIQTKNAALNRMIALWKKSQERKLLYRNIPKRLELFSATDLMHIFAFDLEQFNMKQEKPAEEKPLGKWEKREREYRAMLAGNMKCAMHSKMTVDESVEFLRGFFEIRDERNQTNHAAMAGGRENAALEELIESYVERLRNA